MSKLTSARDQLKRQMLRVELISMVVEFTEGLSKNPPKNAEPYYKEVADDVARLFAEFAEQAIDPHQKNVKPVPPPQPKVEEEQIISEAENKPSPAPSEHDQIANRVQFMQQWRSYADKVMTVKTSDGVEIVGRLTSIDFPYLVIKDESKGMKFRVDPNTVKPVGGR